MEKDKQKFWESLRSPADKKCENCSNLVNPHTCWYFNDNRRCHGQPQNTHEGVYLKHWEWDGKR